MSNQGAVVFAHMLAKAHADAALAQFNDLQRLAHERKKLGAGVDFKLYFSSALPAATGLALALELTLKVVYFQNFGKFPQHHDLEKMVQSLPRATRGFLAATYDEIYSQNHPFEVTHLALSFAEPGEAHPDTSPPDLSSFADGLAHANFAYIKWRYVYEHMEMTEAVHIHFRPLLALIEAAHAAIDAHKGDIRVGHRRV